MGVEQAAEQVIEKTASNPGMWRKGAETAWGMATSWPKRLLGGATGLGGAAGKTKIGALLLTGGAMVAGGFGLKSWYEHREQKKQKEAIAMVPEAIDLRNNIEENQQRLQVISAELGQYNPKGNFRETVRNGGVAQGQPDFNL